MVNLLLHEQAEGVCANYALFIILFGTILNKIKKWA